MWNVGVERLQHVMWTHSPDYWLGIDACRLLGAKRGDLDVWTFDGTLERTFRVSHDCVWAVAALPDGEHFVVGLSDVDIVMYHVDGTRVHTFKGHTDEVIAVAVTRDGQHIISCSADNTVKVWSVASKSLVSTCGEEDNEDDDIGHTDSVYAVAAMPDGQRILSGGQDRTVAVWLLDGTLKKTFVELHDAAVNALVALPDNQHALSGSYDTTVKLFNVNDGTVLHSFTHHPGGAMSLALLPDGRRFVSLSRWEDTTACIVEHGLAPVP